MVALEAENKMLRFKQFMIETVSDYLHMAQFDDKYLNDFINMIEPNEKEYGLTNRKITRNGNRYMFSYDKGGKQKSFKKFLHTTIWPEFNKKNPKTRWTGK